MCQISYHDSYHDGTTGGTISVTISATDTAITVADEFASKWNEKADKGHTDGVRASTWRDGGIEFFVRRSGTGAQKSYNIPLEISSSIQTPPGFSYSWGVSGGRLIRQFIASQAAIPASAFDSEVAMTSFSGRLYNLAHGLASGQYLYPATPDVYGRFPGYSVAAGNGVQRPYFRLLQGFYPANTFYRFFNQQDYATNNAWLADQAAKPAYWGLAEPYYFGNAAGPGGFWANRFEHGQRPLLSFPQDSFEIFSFAAQGRISLGSVLPGAYSLSTNTAGLYVGPETNMNDPAVYNMSDRHIFHSAQFNMDLAWHTTSSGRGLCWSYWRDVISEAVPLPAVRLLPNAP